jgi:putative endonuclease
LKLTFGIWNFIFGILTMAEHNELGKLGEELAVDFLEKNGYEILETNWTFQKAEVDIIAKKDAILAVIEVKTRSSLDYGLPQDFVKPKKIQLLVKAINEYVIANDLDVEVRFDIIAIHATGTSFDIEHLEAAFYYFNN